MLSGKAAAQEHWLSSVRFHGNYFCCVYTGCWNGSVWSRSAYVRIGFPFT